LSEAADEYEEVAYEQSVKLMQVMPPGPPAWHSSYIMRVPEELQPGTVLEVSVSSMVKVIAHLFRKDASGAVHEPVLSPPPASKLHFVYPVDVAGAYQLRLSQSQLYSIVDAKVKFVIKKPKPKEEPGGSGHQSTIGGQQN
jgi:hypothetical protein